MPRSPVSQSTSDLPTQAVAILVGAIRRRLGLASASPAVDATGPLGPVLRQQVRWHRVRGFIEADPFTLRLLDGPGSAGGSARDRITARVIELTVILDRLQRAGIPAIPLKGVLLSARLYGDPTLRGLHDHDLLVAPDRLDEAIAVLAPDYLPDDYSRRSREACEHHELLHPSAGGSLIELHWRLLTPYSGYTAGPEVAWESARPRQDAGLSYLTLDPAVEAVMITVHAAHHFGARLHWLADVAALVLQLDATAWERALLLAEGWRVRRALLTALAAASLTFELPLPPDLARAVTRGASHRSAAWMARRLHAGLTCHPSQFQGWHRRCAMLEDWRSVLSVVPRLAFTPIPEDYASTGLPRWAGSITAAARPILILGRALSRKRQ